MRLDHPSGLRVVRSATIATALVGCGARNVDPVPVPTAHVVALATYHAPLGTPIRLYGENFPRLGDRRLLMLQFRGEFAATDGRTISVDTGLIEARVNRPDAPSVATWRSFGPFFNPLATPEPQATPEAVVGTFRGRVFAHITNTTGGMLAWDAVGTPIFFEVEPSITVTELQPVGASCNGPPRVGLSRVPYRLSVQTLGFTARSITYTLEGPPATWNGPDERVSIQHSLDGVQTRDTVGRRGELVLPAVPYDRGTTAARFTIEAMDTRGVRHQNSFALEVHRPIEQVRVADRPQIVHREAPVALSRCIPGGAVGIAVSYEEPTVDVRPPRVDVTYDNGVSASFAAVTPEPVAGPVIQSVSVGPAVEWGSQQSETNGIILTQTPSGYYWLRALPEVDQRQSSVDPAMATTWDQPWIGSDSDVGGIRAAWRPFAGQSVVFEDADGAHGPPSDLWWLDPLLAFNRRTGPPRATHQPERPEGPAQPALHRVSRTQSNALTWMERDSLRNVDTVNYTQARMAPVTREVRAQYVTATSANNNGIRVLIPAWTHGVWYRQAIEQRMVDQLRAYNLCGEPMVIGEVSSRTWTWKTELALTEPGARCNGDELPRPRQLEPAGCFDESCR